LGFVREAVLNVGDAATSVITEVEATVAGPAEVLVGHVGQAVGDVHQAKIAVDGQTGHVNVALNAQTQAVVLEAVANTSGNARSPVS